MADSSRSRKTERQGQHQISRSSAATGHYFYSSRHTGIESLDEGNNDEDVANIHDLPRWNQSMGLHCDFISFLAICQWREINILGITWQPAISKVGRGGTAHVYQSQINPQTSFAFKRVTPSTYASDEQSIFRALISEILVLGHPQIREHSNIVNLVGICWDVADDPDTESIVWPVLVYEKAELGDLSHFMELEVGKHMTIDQRLEICVSIGSALILMHSCAIFHGDINPKNVLIFKEGSGASVHFIAKLSDFGFSSTIKADDSILIAQTRPWDGPEWHHRGFALEEVKKMDVYSFGMLCLWLICKDSLPGSHHDLVPTLEGWDGGDLFSQSAGSLPGRTFLETLKTGDKLPALAHELLALKTDVDPGRTAALSKFFLKSLIREPKERSSDFVELQELLTRQSITHPPAADDYPPLPTAFQVARSFTTLMDGDYRVRKFILHSLERQATNYRCDICRKSAAFQTAFCYFAGFGIPSNVDRAQNWLGSDRSQDDIEKELELVRDADWAFTDDIEKLMDEGYDLQMNHAGEYQRARILEASQSEYAREIEDLTRVLGRSHPVIRRLQTTLAGIYFTRDDFERAERLDLEIKEQLENDPEYGTDDYLTLIATNNLAGTLTELGKHDDAEKLYLQSLAISERVLGPLHPFQLLTLNKLALLSQDLGNHDRAETLCRQALERQDAVLGESHENTLDTLSALGTILTSRGKYEEAWKVHQKELRLTMMASGLESPQAMLAINSLAIVSRLLGKYESAENLNRRAIRGLENFFGKEHSDVLGCKEDLAKTLSDQGRYEEAEDLHRQILARREELWGPKHPAVLTSLDALAVVLSAQGHHEAAEQMMRQVLEGKNEVLGPDHPDTLTGMGNLASMLFMQKKLKAAMHVFETTLQRKEQLFEKDHPSTLQTMNDLGTTLTALGKFDPAATLFERALEGRRRVLGQSHPVSLTTLNNLAAALTHLNRRAEAEAYLNEVLDYANMAASSDFSAPEIASTLWNLADLLHRQKRFDEAFPFYERACAEFAQGHRAEYADCAAQFADLRKEQARRAKGGVWKLDIVHAAVGVGEVVWDSLNAAVLKVVYR